MKLISSPMPLSKNQVEHIARLARLQLTPDEVEQYSRELTVILDYIDQLKSVDTTGLEAYGRHRTKSTPWREDKIVPSLAPEQALANASQQAEGFFLVPKVIEK